jgi:1-acyl-sn-glycerol-3-phosphate acyltransferase
MLVETPQGHPDGPLLFVSNHVSFWDGFLLRKLQQQVRPGAPLYTVMLESELARRPFLGRLGALGITPGDPSSFRALATRLEGLLAREPRAVVAFFPQGRIWPSFKRPLGFHPGVSTLLRKVEVLQPVPVGIHLEGHNRTGLTAYLSAGEVRAGIGIGDYGALEGAVEERLDRILGHLVRFGEDAPEQWPPPPPQLGDHTITRGGSAPLENRQMSGLDDER